MHGSIMTLQTVSMEKISFPFFYKPFTQAVNAEKNTFQEGANV